MKVEELADRLAAAKKELATHTIRVNSLKALPSGEEISLFTDNIWFTMNRAQFVEIQDQRLSELEQRVSNYEGLLKTLQATLDQELGNV